MKRKAMIVVAAGMLLGSAAYAQGTHERDSTKNGPAAGQGHDAHCCKPDPADPKGVYGMPEQSHDHAQVPKRSAKKPARKPGAEAGPTAK